MQMHANETRAYGLNLTKWLEAASKRCNLNALAHILIEAAPWLHLICKMSIFIEMRCVCVCAVYSGSTIYRYRLYVINSRQMNKRTIERMKRIPTICKCSKWMTKSHRSSRSNWDLLEHKTTHHERLMNNSSLSINWLFVVSVLGTLWTWIFLCTLTGIRFSENHLLCDLFKCIMIKIDIS